MILWFSVWVKLSPILLSMIFFFNKFFTFYGSSGQIDASALKQEEYKNFKAIFLNLFEVSDVSD